jgi:hypothetical protein
VITDGKLKAYFEYNGTVDFTCTRMYPSTQEMLDNWRADNMRDCTCGYQSEDVVLYTTYGKGFHWAAKACFKCMAITDGLQSDDSIDGRPDAILADEK